MVAVGIGVGAGVGVSGVAAPHESEIATATIAEAIKARRRIQRFYADTQSYFGLTALNRVRVRFLLMRRQRSTSILPLPYISLA